MDITINNANLFYNKRGTAKKHLLLFHGFGQDHRTFTLLTETLSDNYTCYCFDLFFHGDSTWAHGEKVLEKNVWKEFIDAFLLKEGIERFSLLGFSIGAKFALATLELFPEKSEKIFLIAPDGIKNNAWYWLATHPVALRKLFKSMILHPNRFFKATRIIKRLKLIDEGLLRFAEHHMNSEEKRRRVYFSWVVFRKLKFNLKKITSLINQYHIATTVIIGKDDKVIDPNNVKNFLKRIKKYQLETLNASHNRLIRETDRFI